MLTTIGYEGANAEDFVSTLQLVDVEIVIDIRDRAQSRRPGFSKSALKERLLESGIGYVHFKELGDPKDGREAARAGEIERFRRIYSAVLETNEAIVALDQIAALTRTTNICLLCYERDHWDCHRKIVADRLESMTGCRARHLGVPTDVSLGKQAGRVRHLGQGASA